MTIIGLIVALIVIGLLLYLVDLLPIDARIKLIIRILVIVCVILWLLESFGVFGPIGFGTRVIR